MKILCTFLLVALSARAGELEDLTKVSQYWQHAFDMDDWSIVMMPTTRAYIQTFTDGEEADAASGCDVEKRTCIILIPTRSEYGPSEMQRWHLRNLRDIKKDQRDSIIHEYLHQVIRYADNEQAVSMLAHLLNR